MPARNSIKKYVENSYYHIYNRGVEKRIIFKDKQDYVVFLSYLKSYLVPKDVNSLQKQLSESNTPAEKSKILKLLRLNNFTNEIKLLAYCLMSNHFHLLVKQSSANSIDNFINSLNTRYVMYFNKKNKRIGPLFQGVYKAVLVESDEQLLHLSAYIHRNPIKHIRTMKGDVLESLLKQPTSFSDYLGITNSSWINKKPIEYFFSKTNINTSYKNFVIKSAKPDISIANLILE